MDILQEIYDSEINISISWFWDGGIDVSIGDGVNGIRKSSNFDTVQEAINWLEQEVPKLYPDSDFAVNR